MTESPTTAALAVTPAVAAATPSDAICCARLFWACLAARTAFWTLVAVAGVPNAPLDLIEWLAWGHEWQWGYPKHPPFPAWAAEVFSWLSPGGVWGVYLAGYLCVAGCLWAVWRLGRELLPPRLALAAVAALEGMIFFTADAAEFNNNVVLGTTWAVAILCFHRALRTDRFGWWVALGTAFGLGLLSKYTMAVLLGPMGLYVLADRPSRRLLGRPGPYLAAAVALGLFAPHLVWMARHDFVTVGYGLDSAADSGHWVNHLKNPAVFAASQLGRLLPVFFVLAPLTSWHWRRQRLAPGPRRERDFLTAMVLGPVALLLAGSLVTGIRLREIWGSPLWSFTGVLLLAACRVDASAAALARARRNLGLVVLLAAAFALGKNVVEPLLWHRPGRANFPGRRVAEEVTREWHRVSDRPLPVVAGECWLAGNVSCYADDRPSMYSSGVPGCLIFDAAVTPWTGDDDLRDRGGALVWDADQMGDSLPTPFRARFPTARPGTVLVLPYQCLLTSLPPARIGVAIVPPGQ